MRFGCFPGYLRQRSSVFISAIISTERGFPFFVTRTRICALSTSPSSHVMLAASLLGTPISQEADQITTLPAARWTHEESHGPTDQISNSELCAFDPICPQNGPIFGHIVSESKPLFKGILHEFKFTPEITTCAPSEAGTYFVASLWKLSGMLVRCAMLKVKRSL